MLFNHGKNDFTYKKGDHVVQLILEKIATPAVTQVRTLEETERGDKAFGSIRKKTKLCQVLDKKLVPPKKEDNIKLCQVLAKNLMVKQKPMLTKINNMDNLETKIVAPKNDLRSSKHNVLIEVSEKLGKEKHALIAFLDSGAIISRISPRVVQKLELKLYPAPPYICGLLLNADGTINKTGEITHQCQLLITYKGHIEWMSFPVFDMNRSDMILGHNWLK